MASNAPQTRTRVPHLDAARALATLLVVLNHAVEYAWPVSALNFPYLSEGARLARFSLFTLGRLGVPLFLFLSGALNLSRPPEGDGGVLRFYRRKLLPLLLCCEGWIVAYHLFMSWREGTAVSPVSLLKKMLFLEQSDLQHLWYIAMLLGVYLAVPFLGSLLSRFSARALALPMAVVLASSFLLPLGSLIRAARGEGTLSTVLDLNFLGGHYGFYLVLGLWLERGALRRVHGAALAAAGLASFAGTVLFQLWCWGQGYGYAVWYSFPGLLLCSVCLFELLRRLPRRVPGAETVARLSLAVFFLHRPLQLLLLDVLPPGQPVRSTALLLVLPAAASLLLAALCRRCRPLARALFLIRD